MRPESLTRAIELDDEYPDNVCPGCKQDITGWEQYEAHYGPEVELGPSNEYNRAWRARKRGEEPAPRPFTNNATHITPCPWTADYLSARRFRRRFIAKHYRAAS